MDKETAHVLVVDDEEKSRLYLANILSDMYRQFSIQLAASPSEAIFILKKQPIDIALVDVEMPGMSGLEMLKMLQKENLNTTFIIVSGYRRPEFIQSALRLGAIDYLDKPVNPTELGDAIEKALKGNQLYPKLKSVERFCLLTDVGERFVDNSEIAYFQSEKRYAKAFFVDGTSNIVRTNLVHLIERLPQPDFLHVGRKYIANIHYIKYISKTNKTITLIFGNEKIILDTIFPEVLTQLLANSLIIK